MLPVLILVVGAIIDFGFVFAQQITFNTAARDASRAGVVKPFSGSPPSCATIATKARDGSTAVGVQKTAVAVTVTGPGATCSLPSGASTASGNTTWTPCTGSASSGTTRLLVTMSYASSPPFPVPFMGTTTLTSRGDFQCEYT